MTKATYQKLRAKMQEKMQEKIALRNKEIERIQKFIDGLDALYGDDDDEAPSDKEMMALMINKEPGITDAIRTVLFRNHPVWLSPMRVRGAIAVLGLSLDSQSNPMASIHTILKRLALRGEIESKTENSETLYRWIPIEKRKPKKS